MSSYCLGSGRAYGFELEVAKHSSPSPARSSSPSSTVSESSNAPRAVSFKKARAPRKRPNQTYNEAAALLATVYPAVFSASKVAEHAPFAAFSEPDDLLPPLPVLSDAAFLIHKTRPENHIADGDACLERKHRAPPADWECASPASNVSWEPTPLDPFDNDFDAESILDEEIRGGIDSIIGDSAAKSSDNGDDGGGPSRSNSCMNPLLRSIIGHKLGAKFHLGLGFTRNFRQALRNSDEGEWWRSPAVPVRDINPDFKPPVPLPPEEKTPDKKEKKKIAKADDAAASAIPANSVSTPSPAKLKASLGLKLSHEDVLRSWSGRGSIFSDSPNSASDALARLAGIDLFLDADVAGGVREASVLRYKEKRRTRLFAKKIRYEVRKTNADQRPRMKGRFVRRPFEAIEEERP